MGKAAALETERQRISAYLHDRLVPELLAVTFSLEAVCYQLEQEGHSAEPKLKEVCRTLTEVLRPLHEELLNSVAPIQTLVNHWGPTIPEWAEISNPPKTLPAILASSAGFKIGRKPENQFPAR